MAKSQAVVLVKALPRASHKKHDLTICCAAIEINSYRWLRLYPVTLSHLHKTQKFRRWDIISFEWVYPKNDVRPESRRVTQNTIQIEGQLKKAHRHHMLERIAVHDFPNHEEKTFILLRAKEYHFSIEDKPSSVIDQERQKIQALRQQPDLFGTEIIPYEPAPYYFKYRYKTGDTIHNGTCQDWEIDATFHKWSKLYGEESALGRMKKCFGEDFPRKGMALAMGTHSLHPDTWLINGVIRMDKDVQQGSFMCADMV